MALLRSFGTLVLLLPLATLVSGCAGDRGSGAVEMETWSLEGPSLRIGTLDEGPEALTSVDDVSPGPGGEVFVLQPHDHQVKVFDAGGAFVRTIGREGEGPGELQRPTALGFRGDTLWVQDGGLRRISFYAPGGEPLDDRPYPQLEIGDERVSVSFARPLPDGRDLFLTTAGFQSELEGTDHPFPILVTPAGGGPPDTVAYRNLVHDKAIIVNQSGGQIVSIMVLTQNFSDATLWEVTADGTGLVLADRPVAEGTAPAAFHLTRVTMGGDTAFSVAVPYEPVPVPAARVDSVLAPLLDGPLSEAQLREALFLPAVYPPVSHLVAGADGTIWVEREERPGRPVTWEVYGPDGAALARLQTPPGLTVHEADRTGLWGVVTDDLDVPYVVHYTVAHGVATADAPDGR